MKAKALKFFQKALAVIFIFSFVIFKADTSFSQSGFFLTTPNTLLTELRSVTAGLVYPSSKNKMNIGECNYFQQNDGGMIFESVVNENLRIEGTPQLLTPENVEVVENIAVIHNFQYNAFSSNKCKDTFAAHKEIFEYFLYKFVPSESDREKIRKTYRSLVNQNTIREGKLLISEASNGVVVVIVCGTTDGDSTMVADFLAPGVYQEQFGETF